MRARACVCRYFLSIIQRLTALTSSHYLADEIEYHLHSDTGNETTTTGTAPFHAAAMERLWLKSDAKNK